jgi:hypothetical protein
MHHTLSINLPEDEPIPVTRRGILGKLAKITPQSQHWLKFHKLKLKTLRMAEKVPIHAIFIDFSKAFDMHVDHRILLSKLASMNLTKSFWLWIRDFLSMRSQQVKLLQMLSSSAPCPAGVPQGSVISPLLFNVYIDDLEDEIPANLTVYNRRYLEVCRWLHTRSSSWSRPPGK